jgi:hypothetical protein
MLLTRIAAAGLAAATLAAGASAAPLAAKSNSVSFDASPGPDAAAPAISNVTVSNDDQGLVTFRVTIPNRPSWSNDMDLTLFLDTDQNPQTGGSEYEGADSMIDLSFNSVDLASWNGSAFHFLDQSPASLVWSYANGVATIEVKTTDLAANITGFNFYAVAVSGMTGTISNPDYSNAHYDFAPAFNHADWNYPVRITPLQIAATGLRTLPARPTSGQPFSASMTVTSTIPSALARDGQVTCTATLGGKRLVARAQGIANGRATCGWQLPRGSKHKRLRGTVGVSVQGLNVSKSFTVTVA